MQTSKDKDQSQGFNIEKSLATQRHGESNLTEEKAPLE